MRERYEIHFVTDDCKQAIIVERSGMSDLEAWKAALLHHGECAGTMFNIRRVSEAIERAGDRGIKKVRWNKASHTIAWSERAKLARSMVGLKIID